MNRFFALPAMVLGLLALAAGAAAQSNSIDFEEIIAGNDPAIVLGDEYAELGVEFVGSDGAIWHGDSDGDPGDFGLEGTSGPSFLGFDGASFSLELRFDAPVQGFTLDAARAKGGTFHIFYLMTGSRDGVDVELTAGVFGPVGAWSEATLVEEVDHVLFTSIGDVRFGIDHIRWEGGVPSTEPIDVEIDILPGSAHNLIRGGRRGVVPVVLFGADDFDVLDIELESVGFGPDRGLPAHGTPHLQDTDGDGLEDLLIHFRVEESGLDRADGIACVVGALSDGYPFDGCDVVTPVGRN